MATPPGYLSGILSKGNLVFPFTLPVSSLGSGRTFRSILFIQLELLIPNSACFGLLHQQWQLNWLRSWSLPHPWPQAMWWEKNALLPTHTFYQRRSTLGPVSCPFKIIALEARSLFQFWGYLAKDMAMPGLWHITEAKAAFVPRDPFCRRSLAQGYIPNTPFYDPEPRQWTQCFKFWVLTWLCEMGSYGLK